MVKNTKEEVKIVFKDGDEVRSLRGTGHKVVPEEGLVYLFRKNGTVVKLPMSGVIKIQVRSLP